LANLGYQPTLFEKSDKAGGMLRFGVPKFRLPDKTLDYDIETVELLGTEIKYNTPLGSDLTFDDLRNQGFEAIFIAIGQYKPKTLKLEGEDLPNVHTAIDFLVKRKYRYWENQTEFKNKEIGILGAGPVAVDVAQTALRLGASKVIMVDIVSEEDLKLVREEIPEEEQKFIEFHYNTSTEKFTQNPNGKLVFNCHQVTSNKDEKTGRMIFKKKSGSDFSFEIDDIVIAVGQTVDYTLLNAAGGDKLKKVRGKIVIDEISYETNIPGIFAGGDIVSRGKNVAIAAISHGKNAAISIDRYLKGEDLHKNRNIREQSFFNGPLNAPKDTSIKAPLEQATQQLWGNFEVIDGIFNEGMAVEEAKRCLSCNNFCSHCQDFAAIYADITAGDIGSDKGYTTVVIWTEKGKIIVDEMIEKGLVKKGIVTKKTIDKAIDLKTKRHLISHKVSPRDEIYNSIISDGPITISELSSKLNMNTKLVRYNALRLVQERKLGMKILENSNEPIFTPEIEE
ncbi:MAG: FAD-dependent oxidoreductase, partial [archaeon]|nr:FAD-dependent oxidoreductase [archaeon]